MCGKRRHTPSLKQRGGGLCVLGRWGGSLALSGNRLRLENILRLCSLIKLWGNVLWSLCTVHFGTEQLMWSVLKGPEGLDQPWCLLSKQLSQS